MLRSDVGIARGGGGGRGTLIVLVVVPSMRNYIVFVHEMV
jgi:hypothetical protein